MSSYLTRSGHAGTRQTPQRSPIPGKDQVKNYAGGYVFEIEPIEVLRRFVILGTESGTYYAGERRITEKALAGVRAALNELGVVAVDEIVAISLEGRAPRNDEAIYALALAAGHSDLEVRKAALARLPDVCRIGTHLFQFMEAVKQFRGHGRALNTAIKHWYLDKDPEKLAYQLVKYRQRGGWSHRDVLRKVKPTPAQVHRARPVSGDAPLTDMDALLGWAARGVKPEMTWEKLTSIYGYEEAQTATDPTATASIIERYGSALPWEALKTEHLTDPKVIHALIPFMPLGALVRQLGRMSAAEALKPMSPLTKVVAARIANEDEVGKSKIHPIKLLSALATYQQGHGVRGSLTWQVAHEIVDALDDAFYMSFKNVESTGKRFLLGLDVSGSMSWGEMAGVPGLTPRMGAAAMAMATARSGDPYHVAAFSHTMVPVLVSHREHLNDVINKTAGMPFGATDCALPMIYAQNMGLEVDCFVIYTDNETWFGSIHPVQALQRYREQSGIDAKLVVVGMTATEFSIADPKDKGMLDVVGFDSAAPQLIADFAADRL